jgi:hypothetical protein
MKKRLVTALALMFGLGVGATAFAAANPFVDVPAKHWAYDAVNKLAKAGIVDGYGDGTFRGDRTMTRYEMAQIVAKAMARSDKADAETKATIDKLATEFSAEIENLGVRVAKLEKKSDNVRFDGNLRVRYIDQKFTNTASGGDYGSKLQQARYRLGATAEVNDSWNVRAQFQGTSDISTGSATGDSTNVTMNEMYAKGKMGQADVTVGRWMQTSAGDVIFDEDAITGIKVGFGNQLKANIYYGQLHTSETAINNSDRVFGTELTWAANNRFNMFGSWNQIKTRSEGDIALNSAVSTVAGKNSVTMYELGASYKFSNDWKLTGIFNKSNANFQSSGFKTEVQYKAIDLNKTGTWQAALGYMKTGLNSVYDTGNWVGSIGYGIAHTAAYDGAKGWYFDGAYVPAKNIKFRTIYGDFKGVDTAAKDRYYRAQVEFFF